MKTKETLMVLIVGVFLGFIAGFGLANYANRRGPALRNGETQPGAQASSAEANVPQRAETAIEQAEQLATDNPQSFDAQMDVSRLRYDDKNYKEALEHLNIAYRLRPDNYDAIAALGNVNFDAGNYEEAERWYTAALIKKPDDVNVRTDLGLTYFFRKPPQVERAIEEYRRSLAHDPRHEQTLQNLTVALIRKGDAAGAQATLNRLETVNAGNPQLAVIRAELEKISRTP